MSTVTVSHKYNETFRIIAANQRRSIFPCENQYIWRKAESAFFHYSGCMLACWSACAKSVVGARQNLT